LARWKNITKQTWEARHLINKGGLNNMINLNLNQKGIILRIDLLGNKSNLGQPNAIIYGLN
jgi:hypothetical protein